MEKLTEKSNIYAQSIQWIVFSLLAMSMVMVFSASAMSSLRFGSSTHFFYRQLMWIVLGLIAMFTLSRIDCRRYQRWIPFLAGVTILALVAIFIPGLGLVRNGARRWLNLGVSAVQPSEFAKLMAVLTMAWWLSRKENPLENFRRGVLPAYLGLGLTAGLIIAEPDFGTSVLILAIGFFMLYASGLRYRHFLPVLPVVIAAGYFLVIKSPYRFNRLVAFLDPWKDPQGKGYHIIQSLIALGEGSVTGKGLGGGRQKLSFLPEAHTDFILAIIGEELGFVGVVLVLGLFAAFAYCGLRLYLCLSERLEDRFAANFVFGFVCLVSVQALFNIAVVSGSIPTKGISLPFVSFGGSGILCYLSGIGIMLNMAKQVNANPASTTRGLPQDSEEIPNVFLPRP